jgi:ABC-type nitrate/sulfonate/bicarbonate transport system substrate-binding protein
MDKVAFPYRASSHLVLLHVIAESGAWEKHGLDVEYDRRISSSEAHRAIPAGEVEFVGGNHVSTYGHRARGDNWVYLGQTLNQVHSKLIVRPDSGIFTAADLRGKKVGTRGSHPGLNDWLQLKQRGLDVDRDDLELINQLVHKKGQMDAEGEDKPTVKNPPLWTWVRDGIVDAAFVTPPSILFAEEAGLRVIDIDPLPMIWFTTISTSLDFAAKHPDLVDRFLKGIIEGIHFFKTQPERSIQIIKDRYVNEGKLSLAQATYTYQNLAPLLEARLYPTMPAIMNVYEEAKRQDPDAAKINPLALWDMHHLRAIDDSGFIDRIYGQSHNRATHSADPEEAAEKAAAQERMIAEIKACGHPEGEQCACD